MEVDGQDMRPEPLDSVGTACRACYHARLRPTREGIQLSEALAGDGAAMFRHACGLGLEGIARSG
jgi:ATP-dependent DNA ligase